MSTKILILVTNHAFMGTTDEANGTYAPELTHALSVFLEKGLDYDIASIKGGQAPLYGTDIEGDEINREILANETFQSKIANTLVAETLDLSQYNAVFYPGGFGLLTDLAENATVAQLTAQLYENGAVVGAVCHGPAGLLPVTLSNGEPLLADISVAGFTREEEVAFGSIDKIPFLLEEALVLKANQYVKVKPWAPLVIAEDRIITGQNPQSAHGVGEAMVARLG